MRGVLQGQINNALPRMVFVLHRIHVEREGYGVPGLPRRRVFPGVVDGDRVNRLVRIDMRRNLSRCFAYRHSPGGNASKNARTQLGIWSVLRTDYGAGRI